MNSNENSSSARRSTSPTPSKESHLRQGNRTFWSSGVEHGIKPPIVSNPKEQGQALEKQQKAIEA